VDYILLEDDVLRQTIDASTVWREWRRVKAQYQDYAGGMSWKTEHGYEYLIKIKSKGKRERVGPRTAETEKVFDEFHKRKTALAERLRVLDAEVRKHERLNKAVRAGRVPSIVIDILNAMDAAGIGHHFVVVGTHALYAYEAAAGVRVMPGAMATQDVDLLWDARRKVRFMADMKLTGMSMLELLQGVDPTFERKELGNETAINAKGFMVEFLRRMPQDGDPHPFKLSEAEEDLWPVQAPRANVLTEAPRFEQPIMGTTGRMALMRTIAPQTFVDFKHWLSAQGSREPLKRSRDLRQARIVENLLADQRL
jgi:hypothetical protein